MKRFALLVACCFAVVTANALAQAHAPNITGMWQVQQTGVNGTTNNTVHLQQSGFAIVGTTPANGNGFSGTFVSDTQIDGKWHGPGGAGWLTIYVSPNGHSFNGSWGYNGRKENGTFVGNKVLPPSPITAAGKWNVAVAGGKAGGFVGPMVCTQSGKAALCKVGNTTINGSFKAKDKIRAKWSNGSQGGWFSFWFNGDNNSFNGVWGTGPDTTAPLGRVVGQRAL